jgi:hypothetical protein
MTKAENRAAAKAYRRQKLSEMAYGGRPGVLVPVGIGKKREVQIEALTAA